MNINFSYMYRDYGNYKNHNNIIFSNPTTIPIKEIEKCIMEHLIDGEWFYAKAWNLRDLHFEDYDIELDHPVHEFISIEETDAECNTSNVTIGEFILKIKSTRNTWDLLRQECPSE